MTRLTMEDGRKLGVPEGLIEEARTWDTSHLSQKYEEQSERKCELNERLNGPESGGDRSGIERDPEKRKLLETEVERVVREVLVYHNELFHRLGEGDVEARETLLPGYGEMMARKSHQTVVEAQIEALGNSEDAGYPAPGPEAF